MHVLSKKPRNQLRNYLSELAGWGRYSFCLEEAREALGISANAARLAVNRLVKAGILASPARGFYVTVPPEYRNLGCPPPEQFVPQLMEFLGESYYVGLLSAAQYHGAAEQRPQEFQVMMDKMRRSSECGKVRIRFVMRKSLKSVPVQTFNTTRGTIFVATPEATAIDLIGYPKRAGGLDQTLSILPDLAEKLDGNNLPIAAKNSPVAWAQRLGYLLDWIGAEHLTASLKEYVRSEARERAVLNPSRPKRGSTLNKEWKLWINQKLEVEN